MEKKGTKSPSALVQMFESGLKKAARNAAWNWKRDNRKRLFYEIMASPTLIDQMTQLAIGLPPFAGPVRELEEAEYRRSFSCPLDDSLRQAGAGVKGGVAAWLDP